MVDHRNPAGVWRVETGIKLTQLCARRIGIVRLGRMAGHAGEVDLDSEMQAGVGGDLFQFVANLQARVACRTGNGLPQPDRTIAGPASAVQDQSDPATMALNLGTIASHRKVAALDEAAVDQIVKGRLDRVKV